jgi:hypothetical protein
MSDDRFQAELRSVATRACEMAGNRWVGVYDPGEAYWFVWRKVAARAIRQAKSPLELLRYAYLKARGYFWDKHEGERRKKGRSAEVSLESLITPLADSRMASPDEEVIEREVFEYCRNLPARTWQMLIAPFAGNVTRTAKT